MRICFVSDGRADDFSSKESADLIVFGFNGLLEVNYERELRGESECFQELAKLSKRAQSVVVCGCVTNTLGHRRKSALVAENGRLLGISDRLYSIDGEYAAGAELRVYPTRIGKMGVLVAEDIYFSESIRALAACGCDFIVCPYGKMTDTLPEVLLRARAFEFGLPLLLCGEGYAEVAEPSGGLGFSSPFSPIYTEVSIKKNYHLIERRKRGYFT